MELTEHEEEMCRVLNEAAANAHAAMKAKGFWAKAPTTTSLLAALALMHSEVSEVVETVRRAPASSKKCPELSCEAEECADVFLRLLDYCGARGIRLGEAALAKHQYNLSRPHMHGKKA